MKRHIKSYFHEMRSKSNFTESICKTNMMSFHIIVVSMKMWNKLSNYVKCMPFVIFKAYITTMLSKQYLYT